MMDNFDYCANKTHLYIICKYLLASVRILQMQAASPVQALSSLLINNWN